MHPLDGLAIRQHYQNLIMTGNEAHAWNIISEFFDFFEEDVARDHLWSLLVTALKNPGDETDAHWRSNMLFFFEYCLMLFTANSKLSASHKNLAQPTSIR